MSAVAFKTTNAEALLIHAIAKRASRLAKSMDLKWTLNDADMDITAIHCNDLKLDLQGLLNADEANFGHDVLGIRRYIDRNSGTLTGFFVPRCAR